MSKLFYDHLVSLKEVEKEVNKIAKTREEKEELWELVDELIHQKVLIALFDELHEDHHDEFILKLHDAPHDKGLIKFLQEKIQKDVVDFIRLETVSLGNEILEEIRPKKETKKVTSKNK